MSATPGKFSVLINNYNYSRYVGLAIESVLAQTLSDFELIIVDDGSSDSSKEVITRYSDPRITTIFKANGGQGSAFQVGLEQAEGRWVAFLDSDDLWHPMKLERCAAILAGDPTISYLAHNYELVSGEGVERQYHDLGHPSGYYDPMPDFARLQMKFPFVPTSFFCTSLEYARRIAFKPAEWRICADLPFMGGLPVLGKTYVLNEVLGTYRIHAQNHFMGRNSERSFADTLAKMYDCVSAQLAAQGDTRRFDFRNSSYYLSQEVLSHRATSWKGLSSRLRLRRARRAERHQTEPADHAPPRNGEAPRT